MNVRISVDSGRLSLLESKRKFGLKRCASARRGLCEKRREKL